MDDDFSGAVTDRGIFRQSRILIDNLKAGIPGIEFHGGDARCQFIEDKNGFPVRMESKMPRTSPGPDIGLPGSMGIENSIDRVKLVDMQTVHSEVGTEDKSSVRREVNGVGV